MRLKKRRDQSLKGLCVAFKAANIAGPGIQVLLLRDDYRQACEGNDISGVLFALPFILIYPIGIPLVWISLLVMFKVEFHCAC